MHLPPRRQREKEKISQRLQTIAACLRDQDRRQGYRIDTLVADAQAGLAYLLALSSGFDFGMSQEEHRDQYQAAQANIDRLDPDLSQDALPAMFLDRHPEFLG